MFMSETCRFPEGSSLLTCWLQKQAQQGQQEVWSEELAQGTTVSSRGNLGLIEMGSKAAREFGPRDEKEVHHQGVAG